MQTYFLSEKAVLIFRRLVLAILLVLFTFSSSALTYAWETSRSLKAEDKWIVISTYYNPAFGSFEKFIPPTNTKKAWDIEKFGYFSLEVLCSERKLKIRSQYAIWNNETSQWEAVAIARNQKISVKFNSGKPLVWPTTTEENWVLWFDNAELLLKRLVSNKTFAFEIEAEKKMYSPKFNIRGLASSTKELEKFGC